MKKSTVIIKWGLITGVAMCLCYLGLELTGNLVYKGLAITAFAVFFIGLLIGMFQYRNKVNGGYASYGELYKVGMLISLVVMVVIVVYWFVFLQINPSYLEKVRAYQAEIIATKVNGEVSPEQRQMMAKVMNIAISPVAIVLSNMLNSILGGAILSLIAAAIASKSKPPFEEDKNPLQPQ